MARMSKQAMQTDKAKDTRNKYFRKRFLRIALACTQIARGQRSKNLGPKLTIILLKKIGEYKMTSEKNTSPSRILVVDDNEQNRELIIAYLDDIDCEIETAIDGLECLEKAPGFAPDLILLDVMMPRMSGFEVCRKLKSDPETRNVPIIMVTALNELGDIERAVDSGTDDFITKPVNRLELVTRVRSLLRVSHLQNELDRTLEHIKNLEG